MTRHVKLSGQITVFLALCAGLLTSMILAEIEVARVNIIKSDQKQAAMIACQAVLAGYAIPLFERYDVFGIDASSRDINEELTQFVKSNSGYGLFKANLSGCCLTDQIALSDYQYAPLKKEIMQYMETVGILETALDQIFRIKDQVSGNVNEEASVMTGNLLDGERQSAQAREIYEQQRAESEDEEEETPRPISDPRKELTSLIQGGLLRLVLPPGFQLSDAQLSSGHNYEAYVDRNYDFTSSSSLINQFNHFQFNTTGLGAATKEHMLLQMYLRDKFKCAVGADIKEETKLQYELEYIICGHQGDRSNLLDISNRLLMIRWVSNYMYLISDSMKIASAHSLAEAISAAIIMPWAEPIIYALLTMAWAYAESIADLRVLFQGGKIPMMKSAASWKVSIENIGNPTVYDGAGSDSGLAYMDYLTLLLLLKGEQDTYKRMANLMEENVRLDSVCAGFRMNKCYYSIGCAYEYQIQPLFYGLSQSRGGYGGQVLWTECY